MTGADIARLLEHVRLGVTWPEDVLTVQLLINEYNRLDALVMAMAREVDHLREQIQTLRSDCSPFMTAED